MLTQSISVIQEQKSLINPQLNGITKSDTLAINQVVSQRIQAELPVYNFGLGQAPFPLPDCMQQALADNSWRKNYTNPTGIFELRRAIADFYQHYFLMEINPRQVVVGPGSKQLILQTMNILNCDWMIPQPSWVSYSPQTEIAGKQMHRIELDGLKITEKAIRKGFDEITSNELILLLNYPNNPTGLTISDSELQRIARFARNNDILVLSDEIYGNLTYFNNHSSIANYYPEGTITTGGMSKDRSAGGWRLGVAILPDNDELISTFGAYASETYSCVADPIQNAAIAGYQVNEEIDNFMKNSREIHHIVSDFVYNELMDSGFAVERPEGAFYIYPNLDHRKNDLLKFGIKTPKDLEWHLMQNFNVAVLSAASFGMDNMGFRLSLVDYDGKMVMEKYKNGLLDTDTIPKYCSNMVDGVNRLKMFAQKL